MTQKIALVIVGALLGVGCNANPGTGEKIGQIVRVNHTGLVCATWEAELIRGGFSDGSGAMGTKPFHFTIDQPALATAVEDAMRGQTEVSITYQIEAAFSPCRSDSGVFLTSIKPSKPTR
jgi:hypothetical protein